MDTQLYIIIGVATLGVLIAIGVALTPTKTKVTKRIEPTILSVKDKLEKVQHNVEERVDELKENIDEIKEDVDEFIDETSRKIQTYRPVFGSLFELLQKFNLKNYTLILSHYEGRKTNIKPSGRDYTRLTDEDRKIVVDIIEAYNKGELLVYSASIFNPQHDASINKPFVAVTNKETLQKAINYALGGLDKSMDVYYQIHRESFK